MSCPRALLLLTALLGLYACAEAQPVEGDVDTGDELPTTTTTTGDGDGDGDPTTSGDGDGDTTATGDGDGDGDTTATGDGDGDTTATGDGDGDGDTTATGDGDGDGDTTATGDGDGDGDTTATATATATGGDGDGDGDGDPDPDPVTVAIAHNNTDRIEVGLSDSCDEGGATQEDIHLDNSYYRVFDLDDWNVTGVLTTSEVFVGIELADAPSGSQPLELYLYTLNGPLTVGNLTPVADTSVTVSNNVSGVTIPIAATFQPGDVVVVEVRTPPSSADNRLLIGTNSDGQTGPSYIRAADCNVNAITDWADIPPDPGQDVTLINYVLRLTGEYTPPAF